MNSDLPERQKASFDSLVDSGVYSAEFDHSAPAKAFVGKVLQEAVARLAQGPVNVLDCGCGTGAWLDFVRQQLLQTGRATHRLCGFDLSERMIDVAHERLRGSADASDVRQGNVLDPSSYVFAGLEGGFDLIFTYDVVQQLPRARQIEACFVIAAALAPGGIALIFDNDANTRFGRRMAMRKFLTRYFGLKLVPRYYCNAAYPPLDKFRIRIGQKASLKADIVVRADGAKRALIVQRETATASSSGVETNSIRERMS